MSITSREVFVTPELAEKWLQRNTGNYRGLKKHLVKKYARDMLAGRWPVNGESIKFNCDGTLLDGQHRLAACIEAGAGFPTYMTEGIPNSAVETMDGGLSRTVGDILSNRGFTKASDRAAIARHMVIFQAGKNNPGKHTRRELLAIIDAYTPAIDFVFDAYDGLSRHNNKYPWRASVRGAIARAFYSTDEKTLREFVKRLVDMRYQDMRGCPVRKLQQYLARIEGGGGTIQKGIFFATLRAVDSFRNGKELQRLHDKPFAADDSFPLPLVSEVDITY